MYAMRQLESIRENNLTKIIGELACSGSQEAFQRLYDLYYARLTRFAARYLDSLKDVEEVVSSTMMSVWTNREQLPAVRNFDSWIYTLARNKAISAFRTSHRGFTAVDCSEVEHLLRTDSSPESELITSEYVSMFDEAVEQLPEKCRAAFRLVREERLRYKEAASMMDISVKTLESHLASAVRKLRTSLGKETFGES